MFEPSDQATNTSAMIAVIIQKMGVVQFLLANEENESEILAKRLNKGNRSKNKAWFQTEVYV